MHVVAEHLIVSFMPKCFKHCFVFSCPALTSKACVHIIRQRQKHTTRTIGEERFTHLHCEFIKIPLEVAAHCTYTVQGASLSLVSAYHTYTHIYTYHAATVSSETNLVVYMLVITAGAVHYIYVHTYLPSLTHDMYVRM